MNLRFSLSALFAIVATVSALPTGPEESIAVSNVSRIASSDVDPLAASSHRLSRRADCDSYQSFTFPPKDSVANQPGANCMPYNFVLHPCDGFDSRNHLYYVIQQRDGNLAVYRHGDHHVVWAADTDGHDGASTILQWDGNLVQYDSANVPIWNTATSGQASDVACIQDDGNFVIYDEQGGVVWSIPYISL